MLIFTQIAFVPPNRALVINIMCTSINVTDHLFFLCILALIMNCLKVIKFLRLVMYCFLPNKYCNCEVCKLLNLKIVFL